MENYKPLEKLYYKKINIEQEYLKRINDSLCYKSKLEIFPIKNGERNVKKRFLLFYLLLPEIQALQEKIEMNSREISHITFHLPNLIKRACLNDIMVNEIIRTNRIEGVFSTKEEIYNVINSKKITRYSGIVKQYQEIINNNIKTITSPEEIRELYDKIFSEDILKNSENKLDGKLFRISEVYIKDYKEKTVHKGDVTEERILLHLNTLIEFMNEHDVPPLVKACITHYYFEYIHPFYDGNGRFGRLLFSMYLAKKLDIYTGLSLSYAISNEKNNYIKAFLEVANEKNYGELTFFIIGMLNFIIKGQESLIKMFRKKFQKVQRASNYIYALNDIGKTEKDILFLYVQNFIFARNTPLADDRISFYTSINPKPLKIYLLNLTRKGYITKLSNHTLENYPHVRVISSGVKKVFDFL
ncbi:Fic family protein [Fusobacterium perfoetens]|uniref:Fic family protein n=1 Tax=Fusobacterium perfoetens TaxID=852 RepID=UPI000481D0C9|nr:Fic family protein [Fusobacterium perfoetens]